MFSDGGAGAVGVQGGPGLRDAPLDDGEVASIGGDVSQGDAQPFPAAGWARHDCAVWDVQHRGGFGVGIFLDVDLVHRDAEIVR